MKKIKDRMMQNVRVQIIRDGKTIKDYTVHNSVEATGKTALRDAIKDGTSPKIDRLVPYSGEEGYMDGGATTNTNFGDFGVQAHVDWTVPVTNTVYQYYLVKGTYISYTKLFRQNAEDALNAADHVIIDWVVTANG